MTNTGLILLWTRDCSRQIPTYGAQSPGLGESNKQTNRENISVTDKFCKIVVSGHRREWEGGHYLDRVTEKYLRR